MDFFFKKKKKKLQMSNFIQEADSAIGYLVQELKNRNLDKHAHIVIVICFI